MQCIKINLIAQMLTIYVTGYPIKPNPGSKGCDLAVSAPAMICVALKNTASICTTTTGSVGNSG